jgi:hypothetical protein
VMSNFSFIAPQSSAAAMFGIDAPSGGGDDR